MEPSCTLFKSEEWRFRVVAPHPPGVGSDFNQLEQMATSTVNTVIVTNQNSQGRPLLVCSPMHFSCCCMSEIHVES